MRALGVVVALCICGSAQLVRADAKADADQLFQDGRALLETNPKKACESFQAADDRAPNSVAILLNLGVCNEKLGKLGSALKYYQKALAASAGSKDPNAKDYVAAASDAVQKLSDQVAKVTIKVEKGAEHATITVMGATVEKNAVVPLDAGENVITASEPGKVTDTFKVTVKDGDKVDQVIRALRDAPKPPSAKNRKLAGIAIAGGSIVVASVVAGLWANSIQNDFIAGGGTKPNKSESTDKMLKPTITFFAVAGLGTAVGAYYFFTKPKWKGEQAGVTAVAPVVTPDSGGLAVLGRF